jgi:valyl-tRNA synthetase
VNNNLKPNFGTGIHSITPAHSIEDLKLSYAFNLPRDGIICSKTGTFTEAFLHGLKPSDANVLATVVERSGKNFLCSWKHQCLAYKREQEDVNLLSVDGWFFNISDRLKFKCFNELATVKFYPDLNLKSNQEAAEDL